MCGIVAVATSSPDSSPSIKNSLTRMARRGPDSENLWISSSARVKLGHRRLSIVDLSDAGQQPMHNESKRIWTICNGEIYNYPELRTRLEALGHSFYSGSDSEIIPHAYEQWGTECVNKLEGMFAFVVWDENVNQLFAARDRVGIKPLCYAEIPGGIFLASDMGALLPLFRHRPSINPEAVAYAMSIRYIPSPLAIWEGVKKLEPGHQLVWDETYGVKVSRYWSPPVSIDFSGEYSDEAWRDLFERVLKEHLLSDVPVGIFLSGGIDSSSIAAGMNSIGYKPKALTISFPEYDHDEVSIAEQTSRKLNLEHELIEIKLRDIDSLLDKIFDLYDEPHCNYGLLPMYMISETAAKHFKTVLSGDGGDECFGGYPWHREKLSFYPVMFSHVYNSIKKYIGPLSFLGNKRKSKNFHPACFTPMQAYSWKISTTFLPEELELLMSSCNLRFDYVKRAEPFEKHFVNGLPSMRALQRVDLMTFCSELINPKIDRASMGHSLEVRVPFLDRRLIEWGLKRPIDPIETSEKNSKPVLRQFLKSHNLHNVLTNKKQGFGLKIANQYDINSALEQIAGSWWVKSGFWNKDWRKIIDLRGPGRSFRIWSALMMSKWADKWI